MAGTIKNTLDKVTDTIGGTAGQASAKMATDADTFVKNAAIGDRYEILAAKLALQRTRLPSVRAVAMKMIADHTTNTHQMMAALEMNETRDVAPPPKELDSRRQTMLQHLEEAPDEAFDKTYLDQQVLAHEETSTLMHTYRSDGDNPQLRSLAMGAAPVIDRHLAHVKSVRAAV